MRESDRQFLKIISSAIRGEKFTHDKYESIDWTYILEQSKEHNVTGLVYYGLDGNTKNIIDKKIIEEFKRDTFLLGVSQIKSDIQIQKIIKEFNKNDLNPIILKGPYLKELYPFPELRTMGDLDLLIHTDEFKKAQIIIEQMGYERLKGEGGHLEYSKKGTINVELHLAHHFKGKREDEDIFWKNCVKFNVLNTEVNVLSLEDNLVYLCIHMAKHMLISNIGIRQLCDLTLFIEKYHSDIKWDVFLQKIKIYNLKRFFLIMINMCNKALNMYIPDNVKEEVFNVKYSYVNLIIHILEGGVFGKKHIMILESIASKCYGKKRYKILLMIAWFNEIITLFREKEKLVSLIKAPFIVFIYSIKRNRICREIYL